MFRSCIYRAGSQDPTLEEGMACQQGPCIYQLSLLVTNEYWTITSSGVGPMKK